MWIIEKRVNSGSDWHDSHTSYEYIQPSEDKFGWDTKEDAVKKLRDFFKTEIEYLHLETEEFSNVLDSIGTNADTHASFDDGNIVIETTAGDLHYANTSTEWEVDAWYSISEVPDDCQYLVIENFLSPNKYTDSVERIWHKPFNTYAEAMEYLKGFIKWEGWSEVFIAPLYDINREWLNREYEAIDLLDQLSAKADVSRYDKELFLPWTDSHIERLKAELIRLELDL